MQNTIGMSIFTGAFMAFSWAIWRRMTRMSSAWLRSTVDTEMPNWSACRMAMTNERISGSCTRSARVARASARLAPARISPRATANSSDISPSMLATVRATADVKPSPASMQITSRSMMSGSWRRMASSRVSTWARSLRLGRIVQHATARPVQTMRSRPPCEA